MTASSTSQRALLGLLVILLAAIGIVLLATSSERSSAPTTSAASTPATGFDGPTFPAGLRAPAFTLADQNGRRVSLAQYRGHVVVLTFLHSLCKEACPLMAEDIKGALNLLPSTGQGVAAVAITAEPSEDSPANRRAFLARHEMTGRMAYLNGPGPDLQYVWHAYHVAPTIPGQADSHTAFVILIDKSGTERLGYPVDQLTPESLAHDIRALERS
jgi:protein SCO1/2